MANSTTKASRDYLLLTGASSGIGRELAIHLSQSRSLILNGRNLGRLEQTLAHCQNPGDHYTWQFDLKEINEVADALTRFLESHNIYVREFIHCAGVLKVLPLKTQHLALTTETFNTNVFSAMEISRTLTRRKLNQKALHNIVFISSIASQFGARGFTSYCASKGSLDGFMKALAVELAPEVRVNSVLPGAVRSEMTREIFQDSIMEARLALDYPLGIGLPSDIVSAVEFLLSDQARWITGQQLVIDGGRTTNITA